MRKRLKKTLEKLNHDIAIADLRLQNKDMFVGKLTYNDILYLSLIEAHSGEYTASMIADMLYVSRPAVTQKINELEKRGFIKKIQSKNDKRVYNLYINEDSFSNNYYKTVNATNLNIVEKLMNDYKKEDIELFCDMTEKICEILLQETTRGAK